MEDDATPRAIEPTEAEAMSQSTKRSLFSFSKKKSQPSSVPSVTSNPSSPPNELSSKPVATATTSTPSSPPRALSTSPRLSATNSPARSQIFERDVQEPADMSQIMPKSPAIPTHIQTENYIPAALDGASEIITDETLDPENVEIVTHSGHVNAGEGMDGQQQQQQQQGKGWQEEMETFEDGLDARSVGGVLADNASHYGALGEADVRRLSFISFADVVQSEHPPSNAHMSGALPSPGSMDSMHLSNTGLTSLSANLNQRSPSPVSISPPTSNPGSIKGLDMQVPSPKKGLGSPIGSGKLSPSLGGLQQAQQGDLKVETMGQALRKMGSADLSAVRSVPQSPVEGGASSKGLMGA